MSCPNCGKNDIDSYVTEYHDGKYRHCTCNDCGSTWEECI